MIDPGVASYTVAMIFFGAASSLEALASQTGISIGLAARRLATLCALADLLLLGAGFLLFPLLSAVGIIAVGALGAALCACALPVAARAVTTAAVGGLASTLAFLFL